MFAPCIVALAVGLAGLPLVPDTASTNPYLGRFYAQDEAPPGYATPRGHQITVEPGPVPKVVVTTPTDRTTTIVIDTPVAVTPLRPPPPPRRGLGLMITGFSMFGVTYLLTAWVGALIHDGYSTCNGTTVQCRELGKSLMIPFAGPIMAAEHAEAAREAMSLFLVSGIQIATFTMGFVGAVRHSRYKRWERNFASIPLGNSGLALQLMPRLDGGGLRLNYRF